MTGTSSEQPNIAMVNRQAQTRAELLASRIEARILGDELAPGQLIGTIDELKRQSGYARSTVGEAIRLLTDRGVAEVRPGRGGGLYVTADGPVVRIGRTLLTVTGQPTSVADAIAVRDALEPLIDMDAARHRDERDISELRALLDELAGTASQGTGTFLAANWRLHARIAEITPNETARTIYLGVLRFVEKHSSAARHDQPTSDEAWLQLRHRVHRELVEAIATGDTYRTSQAVMSHHSAQQLIS